MKIKINDSESYEIKLKDEVNVQELSEILSRLYLIQKLGKNMESSVNTSGVSVGAGGVLKSPSVKSSMSKITNDKAACIELIKILYFGSMEERKAFSEKHGILWEDINKFKDYSYLRKKWNIQPEEIGLDKFPGRGEITRGHKEKWVNEHRRK